MLLVKSKAKKAISKNTRTEVSSTINFLMNNVFAST